MNALDACSLQEKLWQPREHIKKRKHYFVNKGLSSQRNGFSSSHIWMWELDHKEDWVTKNWCFWTVVLEKTLESLLDCKEIKPVILKEINPEYSLEELMLKLQYFGHLMRRVDSLEKILITWKDWRHEQKGMTDDEMVGWHHWLSGHEFVQALGGGKNGEAWRAAVHGVELDMTERWTTVRLYALLFKHFFPFNSMPRNFSKSGTRVLSGFLSSYCRYSLSRSSLWSFNHTLDKCWIFPVLHSYNYAAMNIPNHSLSTH